jgi:hypothetical protein
LLCGMLDLPLHISMEKPVTGFRFLMSLQGFKTHSFHTSPGGFHPRCGCLVARSMRPHP